MTEFTRVSGHYLLNEGAPFNIYKNRITNGARYITSAGEGRALCSCGQLSDAFPSAYARRNWHKIHKADVKAGTYVPFTPAPDPEPEVQPDSFEAGQVWKRKSDGTEVRVTSYNGTYRDVYWEKVEGSGRGTIYGLTFRNKYTFVS